MSWFATSVAAALLVCSAASADGEFTFSLEPTKIEPGQRARLELRLPLSAVGIKEIDDESELPQVRDDLLVDAPGLQILERDFRRERNALIWRYDVTLYQAGEVTVPPIEVRMGPHSFSTEARKLEVVATRNAGDEALRPEFGSVSTPWHWGRWLRILFFLGLAAVAWHYGRRYWRRFVLRRAMRPTPAPLVPTEPLDVWLRRELMRLRARLESGVAPEVIDDVTTTLREYFARRDQVPARAWTTDEMRTKLKGDAQAEAVVAIFVKCDIIKFSDRKDRPDAVASESIEKSEKALLPGGAR